MRYISTGTALVAQDIGAAEVAFPTNAAESFGNADIGLNNPGVKRILAVVSLDELSTVSSHTITVRLIAGTNTLGRDTCLYPTTDVLIPAGKDNARIVVPFDIALVNNSVYQNTAFYEIGIKSSNASDDAVSGIVMIYLDTVDVELVNGAAPEDISDYVALEGSQGLIVDANGRAKATGGNATIYG